MTTSEITIGLMTTPEEARAFKDLNEEWIHAFFTLEHHDSIYLDDPEGMIVAKGGCVLIARSGDEIVGCAALVPGEAGVFELSKMAVAPSTRGKGVGRTLILATIDKARELGATSLFLGSSTKLANAVHLYESVGFTHVPPEEIGPMPYARADVFMSLPLS